MKNLTREERETVLDNVDAFGNETIISTNDAEDCWNVCTASPMWIRRLEKIGAELVRVHDGETHRHYRLPMNMVSVRRPPSFTDEQRAEMSERATALRQKQMAERDSL